MTIIHGTHRIVIFSTERYYLTEKEECVPNMFNDVTHHLQQDNRNKKVSLLFNSVHRSYELTI